MGISRDRTLLPDAQWARLAPPLPGQAHSPGVTAATTRLFVAAGRWRLRGGTPWRDLPERLVYRVRPLCPLAKEWLVDQGISFATRREQLARATGRLDHGTGAPARGGRAEKNGAQALNRSRGGHSSKLHLSGDARGRLRQLALTGGQAGDCPQAPALLAPDLRAGQRVRADRAYDADYVRHQLAQAGAEAVMPSKKNRK